MHHAATAFIAAILSVATVTGADAQVARPDRIGILVGSHHVGAEEDFEEFNPGVILSWERDLDWSLGAYRNSYDRLSAVAAVGKNWELRPGIEAGVFGGAAWYPEDGRRLAVHVGDVVPIGGLQARVGHAFVQVIPAFGLGADAIVAGGISFPLD